MRLVLCCLAVAGWLRSADPTALERYVAAPDPAYRYTLVNTETVGGAAVYQLDLVSQNWLTPAEVDRTEWHHWVNIFKPAQVTSPAALLVINGGSNSATPPVRDPLVTGLALLAGTVVIEVGQVPNQPLRFAGESQARSEDALIAYTWDKFLRTGDERWPARLPMTKAVVRAMDAASDFLAKLPSGAATIRNFVLTGASKRGWATWTAAAVDPRVTAIAPIVSDVLNTERSFIHHFRAYGFWAPAVRDYERAGIFHWFGSPGMDALLAIEDPYAYRERLTMPKYVIASTGDQFFLPDSSQFYFGGLPGENYLRYVPNTSHDVSVALVDIFSGLLGWYRAIVANTPRPRFSWKANRYSGELRVQAIDRPTKALLWQATNPRARDFRLETIGPAWTSVTLSGSNGAYYAKCPVPETGYSACLVELTFTGPGDLPLVFTTQVVVTPNTYPFGPPPGAIDDSRRSLRGGR